MALLDLLRNAARLPLSTLFARQARLSGYDLRQDPDPAARKAPFIAERRAFVERFYEYARENPGGAPLTWGEWLAARR